MALNSQKTNKNNASILFGIIIIIAGLIYLLKQFNLIEFDFNVWPLFLIAAGVISGIKKGFDRLSPIILIAIGITFLIPTFEVFGVSSNRIIWPIFLIISGIWIVFRTKQKEGTLYAEHQKYNEKESFVIGEHSNPTEPNDSKFLNIEAFFGGRKEIITSKQFNGCSATAICGGVEINLMQADNNTQPMIIDLKVILGGIEIIIPSHWELINEVDVIFGGIEDKRNLRTASEIGDAKKLLLRGSVAFGGLELKSY